MAVSGKASTYDLPSYSGELIYISPGDTPFLSVLGAMNEDDSNPEILEGGFLKTQERFDSWATKTRDAAAQVGVVEGATSTAKEYARANVVNQKQIIQKATELTFEANSVRQSIPTGSSGAEALNPISMESEFMDAVLDGAQELNVSYLTGTYQAPVDNTTARKVRGVVTAMSTNVIAKTGSPALQRADVDQLVRTVRLAGGLRRRSAAVFIGGSFQVQRLSELYGFAPQDRLVGGVAIRQIVTPLGTFGVLLDDDMTATVLALVSLDEIQPTAMVILSDRGRPQGVFFPRAVPVERAVHKWELYGNFGLRYGAEAHHGKITGLASS